MLKKLVVCVSCLAVAGLLGGCPNEQFPQPPYGANGTYVGTWEGDVVSNEPDAKQITVTDCPITLNLTQDLAAPWPTNFGVTGTATIDFNCVSLPARFPDTPPSTVNVAGVVEEGGDLTLVTGGCTVALCTLLTLEGTGVDSDEDGTMDMYDGNWTLTIALAGVLPYQIEGSFTTDLTEGGEGEGEGEGAS